MKEVFPGIFVIKERGAFGVIKPPENIYILAGNDSLIYDAGYGNKKTIKYVLNEIKKIKQFYLSQNKKFKLTYILPSHFHPDHSAGLKLLQKYLKLKIITTRKTFEIIKNKHNFRKYFEPDIQEDLLSIRNLKRRIGDKIQKILWRFFYKKAYGLSFINHSNKIINEDSDILINGEIWRVFPTPGHASDHISLYNREKGVLFSGDNVLRSITTWLGPPDSNIEDYIKSIKYIQKLPNLKLILPAHGSPIENPYERLSEILEHRKERMQQVIDLVNENAETGISPSGIVNKLYPNESSIMRNTARGWIVLTLKLLEKRNQIKRVIGKKKIKFYPVKS
ncbi:MAG: MBL fold metallo-hydrolase [Promethearchaeota archaeon]